MGDLLTAYAMGFVSPYVLYHFMMGWFRAIVRLLPVIKHRKALRELRLEAELD